MNAAIPVSYTHLDVYKRQTQGSGSNYRIALMDLSLIHI